MEGQISFCCPRVKYNIKERTPDHLTIYKVVMLAIAMTLQWFKDVPD